MSGVITASQPSWAALFTGLSPRQFGKLITALRRESAHPVRKDRPWSLPWEDRVLLVAAYWRTNLTLRQLVPLFGVSKSAADRVIDHLGPVRALQQRKRFREDTVLIIDADTQLVVTVGRPLPGNRNDGKAGEPSGAKEAVGKTTVIADGGYQGTGLVIPHRRQRGPSELPAWKEKHNASHRSLVLTDVQGNEAITPNPATGATTVHSYADTGDTSSNSRYGWLATTQKADLRTGGVLLIGGRPSAATSHPSTPAATKNSGPAPTCSTSRTSPRNPQKAHIMLRKSFKAGLVKARTRLPLAFVVALLGSVFLAPGQTLKAEVSLTGSTSIKGVEYGYEDGCRCDKSAKDGLAKLALSKCAHH